MDTWLSICSIIHLILKVTVETNERYYNLQIRGSEILLNKTVYETAGNV